MNVFNDYLKNEQAEPFSFSHTYCLVALGALLENVFMCCHEPCCRDSTFAEEPAVEKLNRFKSCKG